MNEFNKTDPSPTTEGSILKKYPILRFFEYSHLPGTLHSVSHQFAQMAYHLANSLPATAETSTMLRKLLEAKDCAVRAALWTKCEERQDGIDAPRRR